VEKLNSALQQSIDCLANLGKNAPPQPHKAEVIHLPVWAEPQRGVPNATLRSALFAAIQGKQRKAMQREVLASPNGFTIRFTGIQLDQSDLDVWELLLHLARLHPLGDRCEFTAYSLLKALGRNTGKSEREWLKDVIARLVGCCVEITKGERKTYFGSLLEEGGRDEETEHYVLRLNPNLAALFAAGWTATDWEQRTHLKRKPLALWLYGFLATHAAPYPMKVESLMKWSGSTNTSKHDFKRKLKEALEELLTIGAIVSYRFEGDLLHVERVPSPSQQRHLDRKTKTHR
jgi:hypothetical protein